MCISLPTWNQLPACDAKFGSNLQVTNEKEVTYELLVGKKKLPYSIVVNMSVLFYDAEKFSDLKKNVEGADSSV